jgi:hypothetical protein
MLMPHEDDLPPGPVRDFVELLVWLYQKARCPSLREISDAIRKSDLPGTASTETVRRMLNGTTVPRRWQIVEAVYLVLCDLAQLSPHYQLRMHDRRTSIESHIEDAWQYALINPHGRYMEPELAPAMVPLDPWAEPEDYPWEDDGPDGYSDELPF